MFNANIIYSFGNQALRYFVFPFLIFVAAKVLDKGEFGGMVVGYSGSMILMAVVDFGFPVLLMLNIPRVGLFLSDIIGHLAVKVMVSIPLVLIMFSYTVGLKQNGFEVFLIAVSGVLLSFSNYFLVILRSYGRYKDELIVNAISIFLLVLLFLKFREYGALMAISISIVVSRLIAVIIALSYFFYLKRIGLIEVQANKIEGFLANLRNEVTSVIPLALLIILAVLVVNLDSLIVIKFLDAETVANYQIYFRAMMVFMVVPEALSAYYLPILAGMKTASEYKRQVNQILKWLFILVVPSMLIYFFASKILIHAFLGESYIVTDLAILLLTFILAMRCFGALPSLILVTHNDLWLRVNALFLSSVIGVLLLVYLILKIEIDGIVISSLCAHIVLNLIYAYVAINRYRRLQ